MDYKFIILTPESTLLDKRMVYLKARLEKKWDTALLPSTERIFPTSNQTVFVLPFSISAHSLSKLIASLPDGCTTFGGELGEDGEQIAEAKKIRHVNVLSDEEFCTENAYLTAEAALSLIISSTETSLNRVHTALFGYGRIGSRLARMLLSHGATLKVFTSNGKELDELRLKGINSSHLWKRQDIDSFSLLINTIPLHHVIPRDTLACLDRNSVIIDLASGNNNVDWAGMKLLGIKGEHATALPGKYSPMSAAAVLERAILKHLE